MGRRESSVRQVYDLPDLALLAGLLAVGVAFVLLGRGWEEAGYVVLLAWAILLPFWKHGFRIEGQAGMFRRKEYSVSRECRDEILAYLDGQSGELVHKPWKRGGALVDVYNRRRDSLKLARYFDYADFDAGKEYDLRTITPAQESRLAEIDREQRPED